MGCDYSVVQARNRPLLLYQQFMNIESVLKGSTFRILTGHSLKNMTLEV